MRTRLGVLALVALSLAFGRPGRAACIDADGGTGPSYLKELNRALVFATYVEGGGGWTLWRTDGTETSVVRDGLGLDVELANVGGRLFVGSRGALWVSDGTAAGTRLVKRVPFCPTVRKNVRGTA